MIIQRLQNLYVAVQRYALLVICSVYTPSVFARDQGVTGWTTHMMKGPIAGLGYTMNALSFIVGVGFILGSYIQYQAHRDNPQQVRVSTPIFLLCAGLFLIILPMLSWVAEGGSFLRQTR